MRLRLVAAIGSSILQGSVLISEENFLKLFPSSSGYGAFLIDCPSEQAQPLAATLSRACEDVGLELTPAGRRLAMFGEVQNTYLSIFASLGGLGLLLGSVGCGIVVLRKVLERRGELAMLRAVGFSRRRVRRLIVGEHALLVAAGWVCGLAAALVAVSPAAAGQAGNI